MDKIVGLKKNILVFDLNKNGISTNEVSLNQYMSERLINFEIVEAVTERDFLQLSMVKRWDYLIIEGAYLPESISHSCLNNLNILARTCVIFISTNQLYGSVSLKNDDNLLRLSDRPSTIAEIKKKLNMQGVQADYLDLEKINQLIKAFDEAVFIIDPNGFINHANEIAKQFFNINNLEQDLHINQIFENIQYPIKHNKNIKIDDPEQLTNLKPRKLEALIEQNDGDTKLIEISFNLLNISFQVNQLVKIKDISHLPNQRESLRLDAKLELIKFRMNDLLINCCDFKELLVGVVNIIDALPLLKWQTKAVLILEGQEEKCHVISNDKNNSREELVYKSELQCFYSLHQKEPVMITDHQLNCVIKKQLNPYFCCIVQIHHKGNVVGFVVLKLNKKIQLDKYQVRALETLAFTIKNVVLPYIENSKMLRLQKAVEVSPLSILMTDNKGIIEYVNSYLRDKTGYSESEIIGQHTRMFQSGFTPNAIYAELWTTISSGRNWSGELQNKKKNGEIYWEKCFISPICDAKNEISGFIAIKQDITQERKNSQQLEYFFTKDNITGLANRTVFLQRINQALANRKEDEFVAILSINISSFKDINTSLGYSKGNEILKLIGQSLQKNLEPSDVIARISGTEFNLLLDKLKSQEEATSRFKKIISGYKEPVEYFSLTTKIDFYSGIAYSPSHSTNSEELLLYAEAGKYSAKQLNQTNQLQFADFSQHNKPIHSANIVKEVSRALLNDEFVLYYQIQIDVQKNTANSCEALIRWLHPREGLLAPDSFLPLVEQSNLIVLLGQWVIESAFKQLMLWSDKFDNMPVIAVNVSAKQLSSDEFLSHLTQLLKKYPVDPKYIQFELTETSILAEPEASIRLLLQVKKLGFSLAIDDFGTGYSNLSYLKDLPVEKVKIDRCFIENITHNEEDALLTRLIINISHTLGFSVVAEGVESLGQLNVLIGLGCDVIQGYYFSKPVATEQFEQLLSRTEWIEKNNTTQEILLIVDDEIAVLKSIKRMLKKQPITILIATKPSEALEILAVNNITVVMSDMRMPEMSGIEFLSKVSKIYPDVKRIMLTGTIGVDGISEALNKGCISKLYIKPWSEQELKDGIMELFKIKV